MGGGLMQLVAYGAQDVYLTGDPQITFFKVVYRRHTNFAMEAIEQTFSGTADFGQRVSCTISRNGDLCHRMYLEVTLPELNINLHAPGQGLAWMGYVNAIGFALMSSVEIEIGGQKIDKHYSDWMYIWDELTCPPGKEKRFRQEMIYKYDTETSLTLDGNTQRTVYIPLQFWFCRNPGLALPLIALQYHEVKVTIDFDTITNLVAGGTSTSIHSKLSLNAAGLALSFVDCKLWCDYIYLDTDERRRFAQVSHEYLIEQLQFTGDESITNNSTNKIRMNFSHPVKEIAWVIQTDLHTASNRHFKYNVKTESAKILLNGHDRITERNGNYFRLIQPYQHHTRISDKNVYCYSFALQPEEHQPSGTCNFSRIDNATLSLTSVAGAGSSVTGTSKVKVFAVNYNVLRIMSGMGGLAYSN